MTRTKLDAARVLRGSMWAALALGMAVAQGCGSGSDNAKDNTPSAGRGGEDEAGGGEAALAGGGTRAGSNGGGGRSGGVTEAGAAGETSSQGGASMAGGLPTDPGDDGPGYDGVDLDGLDVDTPPAGCVGGFDRASGTLSLTLDASVSVAFVGSSANIVVVNGKRCESEDGTPAALDDIAGIVIEGSEEDELAVIDGAAGLASAVQVDLGAGTDQLVVLGSEGEDRVNAGSDGDSVAVDFDGDGEADVQAQNVESLLVSTGRRADRIHADGEALALAALAIPSFLYGGGANDQLIGGAEADQLFGGIGNDVLDAGAVANGADLFDGGPGDDTVDYSRRTEPLNISIGIAADDGEVDEADEVLATVEGVLGGSGSDSITGDEHGNRLDGGPGDDTLEGGLGSDFISGGAGADEVNAGPGDDIAYGDEDADTMSGGTGDDLLDGGEGEDTIDGGAGDGDICISEPGESKTACEL